MTHEPRATAPDPAARLDELDQPAAVEDLLDKLLAAEPRAVQLQKALIQAWEEAPISRAITAGVNAFEDAWTTDEPASAMARFLAERRAAKGDALSSRGDLASALVPIGLAGVPVGKEVEVITRAQPLRLPCDPPCDAERAAP